MPPPPRARPIRAFFVGGHGMMCGHPLHAWLDAHHHIVDYWTTDDEGRRGRDRFVDLFCRPLSTAAALKRAGVTPKYMAQQGGMPALARAITMAAPDVLISMGFARRLHDDILGTLPSRCINLHPTLLPVCRGPTPILGLLFDDRMKDAGGVTMHLMDANFDTGAIIAAMPTPPDPSNNPLRYHVQTAKVASRLLVEALPKYLNGEITAVEQPNDGATYRRLTRCQMILRPDMNVNLAERLANTLPWISRLDAEVSGRMIPITGAVRKLPHDSNAGARMGLFSIAMNFDGGRLKLRRRTFLHRWLWKLRHMWVFFNA